MGPHGLYLGPSIIMGAFRSKVSVETAAASRLNYHNVGSAIDAWNQSILGPLLIGLGVGAQYVCVDTSIPEQRSAFAAVTNRGGVRPRVNVTVGVVL